MFLHRKSCGSTHALRSHPGVPQPGIGHTPCFWPDTLCGNDVAPIYRDSAPCATSGTDTADTVARSRRDCGTAIAGCARLVGTRKNGTPSLDGSCRKEGFYDLTLL